MTATVPEARIAPPSSNITISSTIRAVTWSQAATLHNWIVGRGKQCVPHNAFHDGYDEFEQPDQAVNASSDATFRYYYKAQDGHARIAVSLILVTSGSSATATQVAVEVSGTNLTTTTQNVQVGTWAQPVPQTIFVNRTTVLSAETSVAIKITAGSQDLHLVSLGLESVPRAILATGTPQLGADRLAFWPRQPIAEPNIADDILYHQQALVEDASRRIGYFHLARSEDHRRNVTSGSFVDIAIFRILSRFLFSGDTEQTLYWKVYARKSDSSTEGEVRINDAGGGSYSTISLTGTSTTAQWWPSGSDAGFTVYCEDPTEADGLPGTGWDVKTVEARRTAGSGNIEIESIALYSL